MLPLGQRLDSKSYPASSPLKKVLFCPGDLAEVFPRRYQSLTILTLVKMFVPRKDLNSSLKGDGSNAQPNHQIRYFLCHDACHPERRGEIMHLVFPKSPSYGFTVMSQIFLHAGLVGSLTLTITKGQDKRIAALEDELAKLGSLQVPKP